MPRLRVSVDVDASPDAVWAVIEDVGGHVGWMEDAVAIRFTTEATSGVGTEFDCDTRVGPFSLVDHMQITEWEPSRRMGVRHVGLVTGTGVMTLQPLGRPPERRTRFTWTEQLSFPMWMAGPVGATVAKPVMIRMWRQSLRNLKSLVEDGLRDAVDQA